MNLSNSVSRLLAGTAITIATGLASTAAIAQNSGDYADNEIIVTAQKREQSVQDVPIAVSALGEQIIQANRVTNTLQLTGLAPGLVARVNPGGNASPSFSMRWRFRQRLGSDAGPPDPNLSRWRLHRRQPRFDFGCCRS